MVRPEVQHKAKRTRRGQNSHERKKKAKKDAYQSSFQTYGDFNHQEQDEAANSTTREWWTWPQQHNAHGSSNVQNGWQDIHHGLGTDRWDGWEQHVSTRQAWAERAAATTDSEEAWHRATPHLTNEPSSDVWHIPMLTHLG